VSKTEMPDKLKSAKLFGPVTAMAQRFAGSVMGHYFRALLCFLWGLQTFWLMSLWVTCCSCTGHICRSMVRGYRAWSVDYVHELWKW
jgi:hypothetical protein